MEFIHMALFALLRAAMTGQPAALPTELSTEDLYTLSKKHDLAHLVAAGLQTSGQAALDQRFTEQQLQAVMRYEQQQYEYERVCALLEQSTIPFIPLKGAVMRRYYPEPWMRTGCDIDILVREADVDRAADLLVAALQYRYEKKSAHDVSVFSPGGVHFELHFDLLEADYRAADVLSGVWDAATPVEGCAYHRQMPPVMFVCYHLAHMAKHFAHGGCGVRPFIDLWLLRETGVYQEDACHPLLEAAGLTAFAQAAFRLADRWFGDGDADALTDHMQAYLLSAGVYGSMDNYVALHQTAGGSRARYVLSRIFMPYEQLAHAYPVLYRHKWLLPYYEVVRWCRLLFGGKAANAKRELTAGAKVDEARAAALQSMIRELDLSV